MFTCGTSFTVIDCLKHPPEYTPGEKFRYWKAFQCVSNFEVTMTAKVRNQYSNIPHLTQDTTWESDKNTI